MSSEESYDPMAILTELLSGSTDLGGMCGGFTADDISGVYKTDNTIVIDWKAGFTDKLRAYINSGDDTGIPQENRERAFIYSIVNTLTEIEDIGRVWMLEDGKTVGMFPQGHRNNGVDPRTTKIHAGAAMIALRAGVPILPVFIRVPDNRMRAFCRKEVIIGKPITPEEMHYDPEAPGEYDRIMRMAFERVCALGDETP